MKNLQKIRFELMDCNSEREVLQLIEKYGAILNGNDEAVKMFAKRLNHIEELNEEIMKSYQLSLN